MNYNADSQWTQVYTNLQMSYPSEYLIRIFKGRYPCHEFQKHRYSECRILDISCGDGRDLPMLRGCGFREVHGTEISEGIVEKVRSNLKPAGFSPDSIQVGFNHQLPHADGYFNYLISWNSCYYMQTYQFEEYVREFCRVCSDGGVLILSIPKKSCFIFADSEDTGDGYCIIHNDYFGIRNNERMRVFQDEADIARTFGTHFHEFTFGSIHDDCFGLNYHWHLAICKKKT
jgi:SAM-dependent methyltransferase